MIDTSELFHKLASGVIRPLKLELGISFDKIFHGVFRLDHSALDGNDLLPNERVYNFWEHYNYEDLSARVISASASRSVQFPYNVQSAIADVQLDNHDKYLTFSEEDVSPVGSQILPKRPLRLRFGFQGAEDVPNFIGVTQNLPGYSGDYDHIAKWTAMDMLSELGDEHLPNMVMMRDVKTGEVLERIFSDLGLTEDMYELDEGLNNIPFVYFEANKSVANALRELIQAENGYLWQTEEGKIKFEQRNRNAFKELSLALDDDSIISIAPSRQDGIINSVTASAEIREVKEFQQIFVADNEQGYQSDADQDAYRVPAGRSLEIWLELEDPAWSIQTPSFNGSEDGSSFSAKDLNGDPVSSGILANWEGFAKSIKVSFSNANNFPVSISYISVWGEPARMIGGQEVEYFVYDADSVDKFGRKSLEITENSCFGSLYNLKQYVNGIVQAYSEYSPSITVKCKGNPALQLMDQIRINKPGFEGRYNVMAITNKISASSGLETTLTLKYVTNSTAFILDESELDGDDVLG